MAWDKSSLCGDVTKQQIPAIYSSNIFRYWIPIAELLIFAADPSQAAFLFPNASCFTGNLCKPVFCPYYIQSNLFFCSLICRIEFSSCSHHCAVENPPCWWTDISDTAGGARVCLKTAFRQLFVTVCGRFGLNERDVVGYVDRMGVNLPQGGVCRWRKWIFRHTLFWQFKKQPGKYFSLLLPIFIESYILLYRKRMNKIWIINMGQKWNPEPCLKASEWNWKVPIIF